jgi:PKD repeat protein
MNSIFTLIHFTFHSFIYRVCFVLLFTIGFLSTNSQTTIPLPTYGSSYAGNTRGMWFVAPTNFVITGLRVPTDVGTGNQSVHLVKFASNPPAYATTTTAFTTLYYAANVTGTAFINVNIQVHTGDIIGVLGARNNGSGTGLTSYANATTPFSSSIAGLPITLTRLGWQGSILSSPAANFWTEASTVGRVEVRYITNTGRNNAGVTALVSPVNFCGGTQPLKVKIANNGTNRIDSVRVDWRLDGVDQSTTYFQSPLDTIGGTSYPNDTVLTLSSLTFSGSTAKTIKVWTAYPNGVVDTVPVDDTLNAVLRPSLSGSFTIGGTSPSYATFTAAANDLNAYGVCGPVTFTIAPGTYAEKLTLTAIAGTSATNTITFDGVDSSTRILTYSETTSAANIGVISLMGASYVTIKNLKIANTGATYGAGVSIQSGSNYNTISKCRIDVNINATSSYKYGVGICGLTTSTTSTGTYNTITNCKIVGGYAGVALYGTSSVTYTNGNSVIACDISGAYLYGIYDYYQNINTVTDNRIFLSSVTNSYGLYSYYCQNNTIDRNIIVAAYMGMYIYNNNNNGNTRMSCSNNIVNMNGPYTYSTNYGMYALYNVNANFFHNTIYTAPSVASGYCSYLGYGSGCAFKNNIFQSNNASMYAVYCPSITFTVFDNNIMYAPGTNYVYWGGAYSSLPALQAATPTFHQKSLYKIANFVSLINKAEDLHLNYNIAADYGDGNYTTSTDVDGDARCQFAPTIGADESKFGSGSPTANFTTPDTIFVNSPVTLLNNNGAGAPLGHQWYVDGVFKGTTLDLPYLFSATGTYVIKLVTQGCFGIDSIIKTVTVYNPTQKPIANFIADLNTVEIYQNVNLKDLSSKGPTYWYWTIIPGAGVNYSSGTSNTSTNPVVNFSNPGIYQVCLWDSNALGRSTTMCKTAYILVRSTSQLCIFPFDTKVPSGTLYDEGGPNGTYGANGTCTFLIAPCASTVNIKFTQFDITSNSYLRIYNGSDKFAPPMHTGSGFTGTTLPGGVNGITCSSGKMFIEFQKGTSGNGFAATWSSVSGTFAAPSGKLNAPDTMYDCGASTDISFVPDSSLFDKAGAYYKWYFDYANNNQFPDIEGTGYSTAPWSYGSTGTYIIHCEIEGCGGLLTVEDTVVVAHPSRAPLMDFKADLTTATPADIVTLSDVSKYDPIYRRWKITGPGTPTVVKGDNTTKVYGVKFPAIGIYTIQLIDSNCIGSDSLTKAGYIVIINYCTPAVSQLNTDFALVKTTFGRYDTILNGTVPGFSYTNTVPAIGMVTYRDNTSQLTGYQIGSSSITKNVEAIVGIGGTYNFTITRNSTFNPVNFKMWIDYNQDGTFQNSELVASSGSMTGATYSGSVTIPLTAKIGNTRMRIGTAFDNLSNTPCGANQYGEFNDFRVRVTPDITKPVISFTGNDVIVVEVGRVFIDPGYTVTDDVTNPCPNTTTGITSGTQITSFPFSSSYTVTATDGAGNVSVRTRTVNAGPDVTKPVLTMVGSSPVYVEVKSSYNDSGATASDFYFGNFTPYITTISNVDVNKVGTYSVTYNVMDSSGNAATTFTRIVIVQDTQKPVISFSTSDTLYLDVYATFIAPTVTVTDNYYNGLNYTVSGGPVNTNIIGTYVLSYNAIDSSGNAALTKNLTVIVRDIKVPTTMLILGDTLIIDVNTLSQVPEPGYVINDNYYATSLLTVNVNYSNVKLNVIGDYLVRYYVSDPSGNVDSSKVRTYRVVDRVAPVIALAGSSYVIWQRWKPYVDAGNTVTDNYYPGLTCTPDISKVNIYLPGVYQVTFNITDPSGNIAREVKRLVEITADANGINNSSSNNLFTVYPNPNNGVVNVALDIKNATSANIMIYDANGKVVYAGTNISAIDNKVQIDLSTQASGMYFIKVVTDNYSSSKSFSIQK